jgi:hypothetical protein
MDPKDPTINRILEENLREIYAEGLQNIEIQSVMQYPMKENQYLVIYNLNISDSPLIIRAKIIVDTATEELKLYDPALL